MLDLPHAAKAAAIALKAAKLAKGSMTWDEVEKTILGALLRQQEASSETPVTLGKATALTVYSLYPRKVGRDAAIKAIERAAARLKTEPDPMAYLMERTKLYSTAVSMWPQPDKQYVPHAATWYNQGRYADDSKEWQRSQPTPTTQRDYTKLS